MYKFFFGENAWICARPTTHHDLASVFLDKKKEKEKEKEKEREIEKCKSVTVVIFRTYFLNSKKYERCFLFFFNLQGLVFALIKPDLRNHFDRDGTYLGHVALMRPQGRSSWWVTFDGRTYLCAIEYLKGLSPMKSTAERKSEEQKETAGGLRGPQLPVDRGRPPVEAEPRSASAVPVQSEMDARQRDVVVATTDTDMEHVQTRNRLQQATHPRHHRRYGLKQWFYY